MRTSTVIGLIVLLVGSLGAAERPNILWLTVEDMSPHLGCYGDPDARTPHIDAFARQSVRFTHAFATAPVCAPARSCLITGMYATSLGTQRLRSGFPVPAHIRGFPAYLRAAGYHCTNNVKTDYNLRAENRFIADAWNESSTTAHWRTRTPGQPFFAVFNHMTTHQSRTSVWPQEQFEREVANRLTAEERHAPARVTLPPYYPDTPLARQAWARYHDCITVMDHEIGALLAQLDADGLAEDTIVFFFSDHGMGMPRGKRVLHDSGMRVPLLVRVPERWRTWALGGPGTTSDRLVSFVDFAPTVLGLAGVTVPEHMQGNAFMGPGIGAPRTQVFGARDRVDEVFDLARSVRDHRWLYIRTCMPHQGWMPAERYSDASPFRRELCYAAEQGTLPPAVMTYAAPQRALEELYDTHADPHQQINRADDPALQEVLATLRNDLIGWISDSRDAGFVPEPDMRQRMGDDTPYAVAQDPARYPLPALLAAALLVGTDVPADDLAALARNDDPGVRYWSAIAANARNDLPLAHRLLGDSAAVVRIEAAAAILRQRADDAARTLLVQALNDAQSDVALHAARALELAGVHAAPARDHLGPPLERARKQESEDPLQMFIRFSLEALLERLGPAR